MSWVGEPSPFFQQGFFGFSRYQESENHRLKQLGYPGFRLWRLDGNGGNFGLLFGVLRSEFLGMLFYDSMMSGSSILLKKCRRCCGPNFCATRNVSFETINKRLGKKKLKPSTAKNVSKAIGAPLSRTIATILYPYHTIPYHTIPFFPPHNITSGI